jgi:hypothetical protein
MKIDYATSVNEIKLRYVIVHSANNLGIKLKETFKDVALNSYNIEDITGIFQVNIISTNQNDGNKLSIINIEVFNMPYNSIEELEEGILSIDGIIKLCKTYDSFKIDENQEFLKELYNIEMKIREIYTVLACLQKTDLKSSRVRLPKKYEDMEAFKKRLMNELFFIEFSDYKNVDRRKDARLEDLLDSLRHITSIGDIANATIELTHPTLHLEERFNELSRIPEAIGRLESFRNNIAHNRYLQTNDVGNFETAKSIIDHVYNSFLNHLKDGKI